MLRLSHRFLFLLTVSGLMAQETPAPVPVPAPTPTKPAQAELPALERPLEQATVFAREATEAMRVRDWKKAAEMWTEVLKLQPDSAAALSNLGSVEIRLNKPVEARAHLEKAVALRPNLSATWMTLGMLNLEQKNPMLAVSNLTRAVHEDPSDARLHNGLAVVLKQVGWTNGAEQELQKAIDLNSDYTEAHFNLALLYLEQRPPAIESARRHYFFARDLGSPPDELVDKQFKEAGIVYVPPPPVDPKKPKVEATESTEVDKKPKQNSPDKTSPASDAKAKPKSKPKTKSN